MQCVIIRLLRNAFTKKFRLAGERNFNWNHDANVKGKQINGESESICQAQQKQKQKLSEMHSKCALIEYFVGILN